MRIPASSLFGFGSVEKHNVSLLVFAGRDFLKKQERYKSYAVTSNCSMTRHQKCYKTKKWWKIMGKSDKIGNLKTVEMLLKPISPDWRFNIMKLLHRYEVRTRLEYCPHKFWI